MSGRMDGKVVLVTGAARGQGRSHAVRLASEGADIIAIDICEDIATNPYPLASEADLAETERLVKELGRQIVTRIADVRDRKELAAAVDAGVAELGRLDVVVANAGIAPLGADVLIQGWFDVVGVNMIGVINTTEVALPHLNAGASIICTGSIAGMLPGGTDTPGAGFGGSGYAFAKQNVARFVHELAKRLAPQMIRVNAVHPTSANTDMLHNEPMYKVFRPDLEHPTREDAELAFPSTQAMPIGYVETSDVSHAVVYLASDESRYVTGLQLKVDAGALLASSDAGVPA